MIKSGQCSDLLVIQLGISYQNVKFLYLLHNYQHFVVLIHLHPYMLTCVYEIGSDRLLTWSKYWQRLRRIKIFIYTFIVCVY